MTEPQSSEPNLFISYSWSNPDHEAWVLQFAEDLAASGIHVIIDKWDLQPGHDANAFMEEMVTNPDVSKVIMVCDEVYARKSDGRKGGAGTEAQIITPEIYSNTKQDKFVAVVRERSEKGDAYLPTYYKGRIYFDLSNPALYTAEFEKIVRWAWGKQLHVRPPKGERPKFLSDDKTPARIRSAEAHRRASDAVRANSSNAVPAMREYFDIVVNGLERFRVQTDEAAKDSFDLVVVESIEAFTPYRNEILELFIAIAQYRTDVEMVDVIQKFFEKCIPFLNTPEDVHHFYQWDQDNYQFIVHELFLYAIGIFLKYDRFDAAAYLINTEYYWSSRSTNEKMHSFSLFRDYLKSFELKNRRLNPGRLSIRADMLKERNKGTGIDFQYVMTADFVLYLRSTTFQNSNDWWPETLLYADRHGGAFEMFARAKSKRYFDRMKILLGVDSLDAFRAMLDKIIADPRSVPKWEFQRVNVGSLANYPNLGATD